MPEKRERDVEEDQEDEHNSKIQRLRSQGSDGVEIKREDPETGAEDDDDDDQVLLPKSTSRAAVKKGDECPYLDTVSRQVRQNAST